MPPFNITYHKGKLAWLAFVAVSMLVAGLYFIISPPINFKPNHIIYSNPYMMRGIGIVIALFSGGALMLILNGFVSAYYPVVIDNKGITDHSSFYSLGFIAWDDITSISEAHMRKNKRLRIYIKNHSQYVQHVHNPIKRLLIDLGSKMPGERDSTIISLAPLNCSFEVLAMEVSSRLALHKEGKLA